MIFKFMLTKAMYYKVHVCINEVNKLFPYFLPFNLF